MRSASLKSFASTDRFLAEIASPSALRPGYVLLGDEAFLYQRCRQGVLAALAPPEARDFSLHDFDLADTPIFDVLDRAQTPSLMAPFQVIFVRNLKLLYGRGSKKAEFAAIDAYFRSPNPQAVVLFVADHLRIPTDLRSMDYQDKERYDRIRETLGDWCGIVELARVAESDAIQWVIAEAEARGIRFDPDAARELVGRAGRRHDAGSSEIGEALPLRRRRGAVEGKNRITLGDVETMVLAAKQRTLYELTDAISQRDRTRALLLLHGLLNASDGGEDAAIGHLYMLARTFRQMLIILEKNVRDSRDHLGGAVAGLPHAALRRRRPHPPGPPLQIPPRADPRAAPRRQGRPRTAQLTRQQTPSAGAPHPCSRRRTHRTRSTPRATSLPWNCR